MHRHVTVCRRTRLASYLARTNQSQVFFAMVSGGAVAMAAKAHAPMACQSWNVQQVSTFLQSIGLEDHSAAAEARLLSGRELVRLALSDGLREWGVLCPNDRTKIIAGIQQDCHGLRCCRVCGTSFQHASTLQLHLASAHGAEVHDAASAEFRRKDSSSGDKRDELLGQTGRSLMASADRAATLPPFSEHRPSSGRQANPLRNVRPLVADHHPRSRLPKLKTTFAEMHECGQCNRTFRQADTLRLHIATVHN